MSESRGKNIGIAVGALALCGFGAWFMEKTVDPIQDCTQVIADGVFIRDASKPGYPLFEPVLLARNGDIFVLNPDRSTEINAPTPDPVDPDSLGHNRWRIVRLQRIGIVQEGAISANFSDPKVCPTQQP